MSNFKRIVLHWSAGQYKPNVDDKRHYHFMIDDKGKITLGTYKPEDNLDCNDGRYAAHTGGGNTGAISVALCAMLGFKDKTHVGNFPITEKQFEAGCKLIADLCKHYNLQPEQVETHMGFGQRHPETSSYGKIDICFLPFNPTVQSENIEDFIRGKVKWYMVH